MPDAIKYMHLVLFFFTDSYLVFKFSAFDVSIVLKTDSVLLKMND